jgi:outer membrane protein OmpA-like peptidoglycan-associated protein
MKTLGIMITAGALLAASGAASAHSSVSLGISYGPGGWVGPGYYGPYYRPYYAPRVYYPRYVYGPPVYYAYSYPPPPRVVYVERYVEAPPPPPVERARPAPPPTPPAPRAAIPPPRFEKMTLSATELFDFDRAILKLPQPRLDEIARALVDNPDVRNVRITGYTDRLGTDAYNQKLSEKRAEAVKNYLVSRGVPASRLSAIGKGEANPVLQCNDKDRAALIRCLEPNRRVEVEQITIEKPAPTGHQRRTG